MHHNHHHHYNHRVSTGILEGAVHCTVYSVHPDFVAGVYLIYFLIGNLSYIPCSEPSRTVLLLDVMYTSDPTTGVNQITPLDRSIINYKSPP